MTQKYGRTVGVVFVDGVNVNEEIIKIENGVIERGQHRAGSGLTC